MNACSPQMPLFPEGSLWEPVRNSFWPYTITAIEYEARMLDDRARLGKCDCCSGSAHRADTVNLFAQHKSSPEGEAGKVSKARTKLRCAVYLALHSARMELEEHQELSLEDRTSTAKAAWASFNVLDNNFEAEQAARLVSFNLPSRLVVGIVPLTSEPSGAEEG